MTTSNRAVIRSHRWRADRIIELDQLLEIEGFADYGPNSLQVPGADNVELVVTGVSAQRELFSCGADEARSW